MPDIRPAASLTSSLLARRGDARPAMRRQPIAHLHLPTAPHDDLGWNDIGDAHDYQPTVTSLSAMTPMGGMSYDDHDDIAEEQPEAQAAPQQTTVSPLTQHLEQISQRLTQAPPRETGFKPLVERTSTPTRAPRAELAANRKAAFTLRIDAERHLRLRLLSALVNRSSQQLLIEALDAMLASHDKVENLAGQVGEQAATGKAI